MYIQKNIKNIVGFWLTVFYLFLATFSHAQENDPRLQPVYEQFTDFNYQQVITMTAEILDGAAGLSPLDSLELYRLQAIAYYSLFDMSGTLTALYAILSINPDYRLSVIDTPPKVITFFNNLKTMRPEPQISTITVVEHDTVFLSPAIPGKQIALSLLLPGLGHLQTEQTTKGWLLLGSGAVSLATAIFYSIETANRHQRYLKETNQANIEDLYQNYNEAYRLRNISLALFSAIWMYSQADLLFFYSDNLTFGFNPLHAPSLSFRIIL